MGEPWDCSPYNIGNSTTIYTMDTSPTEQCYGSKDATYWTRLGPISIGFGTFYTLALPIYLIYIFRTYKHSIQKDQYRRSAGDSEGQSWRKDLAAIRIQSQMRGFKARKSHGTGRHYTRNQETYNTALVRKHYGKLYEDFRPELYFWRLVLIARKLLLIMTVFLPSDAPAFQAASALLILFFFFVLHVKYQPYLKRESMPENQYNHSVGGQVVMSGMDTKVVPDHIRKTVSKQDQSHRARKRWRKAIMMARTEARWKKQTESHLKDVFEWLYDYNSLEMLAMASNMIILLFGLMIKTYSVSPLSAVYFVTEESIISELVRMSLDNGVFVCFITPIAILATSLFMDIQRNLRYYAKHKALEKMQMKHGRASACNAGEEAEAISAWRREELGKVEDELKRLKEEHDANVIRQTNNFNKRHDELDGLLVAATSRRLMIEDLIYKLTMSAPSNSKEARQQRKDKKGLEKELKDQVHEIDSLNDQLSDLASVFRESKLKLHETLEKEKRLRRAKLKKRIDARLKIQKKNLARKQEKISGKQVPVQMQCRVLVAGNRFNTTLSLHEQHVRAEAILTGKLQGKSTLYENHKQRMSDLLESHNDAVDQLVESHDENQDKLSSKLEELKNDKFISEEQLRVLEDACNRQKNALLQELGEKSYEKHIVLIQKIRARKKEAKTRTAELTKRAEAENWPKDKLDAAVAEVMSTCSRDVTNFVHNVEKNRSAAHDRLMDRLSQIKENEAKRIRATKAKKHSNDSIAEAHETAQREIDQAIAEQDVDPDVVTKEMLDSLLKLKTEELDALDHLQNHPDHTEEDIEKKIEQIKQRSTGEIASLHKQANQNYEKKRQKMLRRLADRKQKEAIEITGAINLAQITGKSKEDVGKQIEAIKKRSEQDSALLMKNLGMIADKKHKRLMDRLANSKAKEIHKIEEIRQEGSKNGKTKEEIEQEIDAVKQDSQTNISNLIEALGARSEKQNDKKTEKVVRALTKLADIYLKEDSVTKQLVDLQNHENNLENQINDLQANFETQMAHMQSNLNAKKNRQADALQSRLMERRKAARKKNLTKAKRLEIEKETAAIESLAEVARAREEAEAALTSINKEYDDHQEELAKAMAIEKELQRANIEKRLSKRRGRGAQRSKKDDKNSEVSTRQLNAMLESNKRMVQEALRRAYERMSKGGLTTEQQLRALLQDVQHVAGTNATSSPNAIPRRAIKPPSIKPPSMKRSEARPTANV